MSAPSTIRQEMSAESIIEKCLHSQREMSAQSKRNVWTVQEGQ